MRKYLVGKEKGCNFALAFEKQRHGGAENEKVQTKALNFVKATKKIWSVQKMAVTLPSCFERSEREH